MITIFGLSISEVLYATVQPAVGTLHRLFCILVIGRTGTTLIKCHHDVGTYAALNVHHTFRGEEVAGAVNVRLECYTLLGHLTETCQREHLEPAAISEHGKVNTVEFVQSTGFFKDFQAGAKVKVIGVPKNNLGLDIFFEFRHLHGLD